MLKCTINKRKLKVALRAAYPEADTIMLRDLTKLTLRVLQGGHPVVAQPVVHGTAHIQFVDCTDVPRIFPKQLIKKFKGATSCH